MKIKTIGRIVDLPRGFVAIVVRYPNGRMRPAPRIIASTGNIPFVTKAQAMDAMATYKADPKAVTYCAIEDLIPLPEPEVYVAPSEPVRRLRHHVTGAIDRGEASAIMGMPVPLPPAEKRVVSGSRPRASGSYMASCTGKTVKIKVLPEMIRRQIPAGKQMGA